LSILDKKEALIGIEKRISLFVRVAVWLSLTPGFTGVWGEAKAHQPLERFPVRRKPLKRLRRQVSHPHPAKAGG
jgi:hypothetical protein